MNRITQKEFHDWVQGLDKDKKWFYIDDGLDDPETLQDTRLYMQVSRFRLTKFLKEHGIEPTTYNYSVYSDFDLKNCPIVPGMHHPVHTEDFSFDFKEMLLREKSWENAAREASLDTKLDLDHFDKMCEAAGQGNPNDQLSVQLFQKAVASNPDYKDGSMRSKQRRTDTRVLCKVYLHKQEKDPLHNSESYGNIDALFKKVGEWNALGSNATETKPLLYIGGPFTEAWKIINKVGPGNVGPVIAMAGATKGESNLFHNQFNILVDPDSARKVFDLAQAEEIDLTLLSTECVKESAYNLDWNVFQEQVDQHRGTYGIINNLYSQWCSGRKVSLFDLLAAMTVTTDLYEGMLQFVNYKVSDGKLDGGKSKGQFQFWQLQEKRDAKGPGLKMFWDDENFRETTKKKLDVLFEELRQTVEGKTAEGK